MSNVSGKIYSYYCYMDSVLKNNEFEKLIKIISHKKRDRIRNIKVVEVAQQSLIAEVMLRYILTKEFELKNNELLFKVNKYGKPELFSHPYIHYNISHSGRHIAIAITIGESVGIDIEENSPINFDIAKRYFAAQETKYILNGVSYEIIKQRFFDIWTRKESYLKMLGVGLNIPLNSFSVLENSLNVHFINFFNNENAIGNICLETTKIHYHQEVYVSEILHWIG